MTIEQLQKENNLLKEEMNAIWGALGGFINIIMRSSNDDLRNEALDRLILKITAHRINSADLLGEVNR